MGEDFGFRCCAMLIIITSMPTSSVYRVMSERIIMFVKIMNRFFGGASFEVLTAVL